MSKWWKGSSLKPDDMCLKLGQPDPSGGSNFLPITRLRWQQVAISCAYWAAAAIAFEQILVSIFQLCTHSISIPICVELLSAHLYSHLFVTHGPLSYLVNTFWKGLGPPKHTIHGLTHYPITVRWVVWPEHWRHKGPNQALRAAS